MKYLRLLPLFALALLFTSCKLRLGDTLYEVPWWVMGAIMGVVLSVILIPALKNTPRIRFTCPVCNRTFKPTSARILFSLHANDHRVLKCPHCGKRSLCAPSHDRGDPE